MSMVTWWPRRHIRFLSARLENNSFAREKSRGTNNDCRFAEADHGVPSGLTRRQGKSLRLRAWWATVGHCSVSSSGDAGSISDLRVRLAGYASEKASYRISTRTKPGEQPNWPMPRDDMWGPMVPTIDRITSWPPSCPRCHNGQMLAPDTGYPEGRICLSCGHSAKLRKMPSEEQLSRLQTGSASVSLTW